MRDSNTALPRWSLTVLGTAVLVGIWSLASLWGGGYFVPPPWTTLADTVMLLARPSSWVQILITLMRVCLGFAAGYTAGTAAGIAMGARSSLDALFKPLILFFQGMPPLLWAIPLVVVMGIGHLPAVLVIALVTLPVVAVTVAEGMAGLPKIYREMLQIFAAGLMPRIKELVFPHLRPFLAASLNVGLVLAVKASVTAEYFTATDGIGFQVQAAYQSLQVRRLFSWGFILILVILLFNRLRVKTLGPLAARVFVRKTSSSFRSEDIRELKGIFLAKKSSPRIGIHGVGFSYRRGEKILEGVSLAVASRDIAVISGDSGVGKTTLLKLAASLLKPTEGTIDCPSGIGFVFQDDRLLPWRNVALNAALPLLYQGRSRASALSFASYLLGETGLDGEGEKKTDELSGGMKKRVALARCFARIPEAILMDEPFSGLHKDARRSLWGTFLKLLSLHPVPVVVVTHFPDELASIASCRLYELRGKPASLIPKK